LSLQSRRTSRQDSVLHMLNRRWYTIAMEKLIYIR
jgi:hypothetical protein